MSSSADVVDNNPLHLPRIATLADFLCEDGLDRGLPPVQVVTKTRTFDHERGEFRDSLSYVFVPRDQKRSLLLHPSLKSRVRHYEVETQPPVLHYSNDYSYSPIEVRYDKIKVVIYEDEADGAAMGYVLTDTEYVLRFFNLPGDKASLLDLGDSTVADSAVVSRRGSKYRKAVSALNTLMGERIDPDLRARIVNAEACTRWHRCGGPACFRLNLRLVNDSDPPTLEEIKAYLAKRHSKIMGFHIILEGRKTINAYVGAGNGGFLVGSHDARKFEDWRDGVVSAIQQRYPLRAVPYPDRGEDVHFDKDDAEPDWFITGHGATLSAVKEELHRKAGVLASSANPRHSHDAVLLHKKNAEEVLKDAGQLDELMSLVGEDQHADGVKKLSPVKDPSPMDTPEPVSDQENGGDDDEQAGNDNQEEADDENGGGDA